MRCKDPPSPPQHCDLYLLVWQSQLWRYWVSCEAAWKLETARCYWGQPIRQYVLSGSHFMFFVPFIIPFWVFFVSKFFIDFLIFHLFFLHTSLCLSSFSFLPFNSLSVFYFHIFFLSITDNLVWQLIIISFVKFTVGTRQKGKRHLRKRLLRQCVLACVHMQARPYVGKIPLEAEMFYIKILLKFPQMLRTSN